MAIARKQYLYTWKVASDYNVVDAITGATLSSHQTHTVTWDCTDLDGHIVPDGEYIVYVEFTEQHAQGPLYSIEFTKGPDAVVLNPPDKTNFKDIALSFTPLVSDFTANQNEICQGEDVIFTDESLNATSWEWNFGDGAVPATAATQGPHTVEYSTAGAKTVSLTINGSLMETKEAYVDVLAEPMADFIFSGTDLTVDFLNNSTGATSYTWDFGDANSSTEANPVHTYSTAGAYLVSLIANNTNCDDTIVKEVMVPLVGLEENNLDEFVRVYPNPNDGSFSLEIKNYKEVNRIRLLDATGQLVKNVLSASPQQARLSIDLGDIKSGIYFLEILSDTDVIVKRVLIR